MKCCKKCNQTLPLNQFHKASKSTYSSYCKQCKSIKNKKEYNPGCKKQYYKNNKEIKKQYYLNTKEQHIKRANNWTKNNYLKAQQTWKKYDKNNREKKNKYIQNRFKNNPEFRIIHIMRSRVLQVLKNKKQNKSIDFLGCSSNEFKLHLEKQFLPEMNWENHGEIWEIDHIIPISSFDLNIEENLYKAFKYDNTQPLFKTTEIAGLFGYKNYIGNRNKIKKLWRKKDQQKN
jgi:hypothetical protein